MSIRWRLTESAMSVRLPDKNVVDSNEINGWLIQLLVHGAGGPGGSQPVMLPPGRARNGERQAEVNHERRAGGVETYLLGEYASC